MRPKHHSLAIIISTCVVIGAAVWFEVWCREDGRLAADFKPVTPLSEITVPDKAELSRIDRLEHSMPVLASPPPHMRCQADLSAFGYVEVSPSVIENTSSKTDASFSMIHRLTLAFEGRVKRFCVIDDRLYTEGASLPDGATVVKIESQRVLIANKRLQQWLTLDPLSKDEAPREG